MREKGFAVNFTALWLDIFLLVSSENGSCCEAIFYSASWCSNTWGYIIISSDVECVCTNARYQVCECEKLVLEMIPPGNDRKSNLLYSTWIRSAFSYYGPKCTVDDTLFYSFHMITRLCSIVFLYFFKLQVH